jgi:methionyl aminopeptidase
LSITTEAELRAMRAVGRVVALTLQRLRGQVQPGISTAELDEIARETLQHHGARSGPQLDYDFPATICISVNEEAVHGIPGSRVLRPGDMVTLDVTAELDGFYADAAQTVIVPPASPLALQLQQCAEAAFGAGVKLARHGVALRLIGRAVEAEVRRRGFRVLHDLNGHGVGRAVHEEPTVPNYYDPRLHDRLRAGMVITLEPIVSATTSDSRTLRDGWTVVSADGSLTAHHEHTLLIGYDGAQLLTAA